MSSPALPPPSPLISDELWARRTTVRHAALPRDASRAAAALNQAVAFAALFAERTTELEDLLLLGHGRACTGDVQTTARADPPRVAAIAWARDWVDLFPRALAGGEGASKWCCTIRADAS